MRKAGICCLALIALLSCSTREGCVERIIQDGVEVVLNRIEPYEVKNEQSGFSLERLFSIDTEEEKYVELGLGDIASFDVDSDGNIYIVGRRTGDNTIFKFDNRGKFLLSLGKQGQGPGEIQSATHIFITHKDEIAVTDSGNNRISFFSGDGTLKEEIKTASGLTAVCPLPTGKFLLFKNIVDPASEYLIQNPLVLSDAELEPLKELDRQMVPNPMQGERLKGTYHIFSWDVSRDRIFTSFQERGYEIFVYDFEGNMVRKIKKEFAPVPVPQAHKDEFNEAFSNPIFDDIRNKIYFPASMPPFLAITADENGWLLVMTYEKGERPGEFIFDLFNSDGVFTGRQSLKVYTDDTGFYAKIRDDRFYSLLEKESGYKELTVFQLTWK